MDNPEQYYQISDTLDSEYMIIGFPVIEIIPPAIILLVGTLCNHSAIGISFSITLYILLRYVRAKYGANIFARFNYSFLTVRRIRAYFRRIPTYAIKYWRY